MVALIWAVTVVAVYHVAHKPFSLANVLAIAQALAGLGGAGLVTALSTGIGLALLTRVELTPLQRPVWAAAIGLGAVSLAGLGLGALGLLRPCLLWLLTAAGLAATGRPLWRAVQAAWRDPTWRLRGRFETLLAAYCALALALALLWALTPPTAWDGLVYHLTGPKLYLSTRRVSHPLDLPYLGFPQLVEMLFAWGMGLAGERTAAPIHWFYGLLAVLALVTEMKGSQLGAGLAPDQGDQQGRPYLAPAFLLSAPSIVLLAGWPYVDLALLAYATLAFLALMQVRNPPSQAPPASRCLILSGAFAGLALSTKYTALALLPALSLALLAAGGGSTRSAIRRLLLLCSVALAVWSPWPLKDLFLTGNPLYPFFFGGVHWDAWRAWWYDRPGTGLVYTAPGRLLTAPWDATIWGVEGAAGYSATIGPLFLALLPLLFLVWRYLGPARRRWLRGALAFSGVWYGFWLWGLSRTALLIQTRLLFGTFGVLALTAQAAVEGLSALPRRPFDLGWLVRAIVALVLILTLIGLVLSSVQEQPLPVLLGYESRETFLARQLGWYWAVMDVINQRLPPDAVVLFLWEPRSYHCTVQCWPDALLDRWLHAVQLHGQDASAIARAWREEGVTYVLLHRAGLEFVLADRFDPLTPQALRTLNELQTDYCVRIEDFGPAYELCQLQEAP